MLSEEERERYSRHLLLSEIGEAGQEKLKAAKVAVIGAGGLGCPVLQYLAAAGVGTIGIIDNDKVELHNLQRQVLFINEDVGKIKAEASMVRLIGMNPNIVVKTHVIRLNSSNALETLKEYEILIDGSDNFPTRYLLNDVSVLLNKPLISGSLFKFEAQLSVFNYKGGPTYRCLYPEPPLPGEMPSCSEIGVVGVLPGIIGSLMANEAIKMITGAGEVLSGKVLIFDALANSFRTLSFKRNLQAAKIKGLIDYELFCSGIPEISADELKGMMSAKESFLLLDVRNEDEVLQKNIGGLHIPLPVLGENLHRIKKNVPVIVHCQGGGRSKRAAQMLMDQGYEDVRSLRNGLKEF